MQTKTLPALMTLLAASIWLGITTTPPTLTAAQKTGDTPFRISGPYTHENLSVFLIHGPDKIKNKNFLTLQEAMQQKKVIVHETSNVNELAVENVSDEEVFIQAGDIVKGGKQDRLITLDFVVPPKSGKMPIAAFCVGQGRWRPRGQEAAGYFASSDSQFATQSLQRTAQSKMDQREVRGNFSADQDGLATSLRVPCAT